MEEKKKKNKRAYLNDFKLNDSGDYVYKGIVYQWNEEAGPLRSYMAKIWLASGSLLLALIAAGCVDATGTMNCAYVIVPYVVTLIMGISTIWAVGRLTTGGNPIRSYIYDATVGQIPGRAACTMAGAVLSFAGQIIYTFLHGFEGKTAGTLLFLVLEIVVFGMGLLLRKQISDGKWVPIV